ncbi:MAG: hypothetical protein MJZ63_05565 [Muribaculaceae bacterium]|nr:hypothetical protein [Muribaculaceae bacterium]
MMSYRGLSARTGWMRTASPGLRFATTEVIVRSRSPIGPPALCQPIL